MKNSEKKSSFRRYIAMGFFVLMGAVCGFIMMSYASSSIPEDQGIGGEIAFFIAMFLAMYAAIFFNIIIHEAGHLLFGLMTGYRFSSFRIGSFMWVKEKGKLKFRRLSVAGTGGQCLMIPPEMTDSGIPTLLYNLGGAIVNAVSGLIFLALTMFLHGSGIASAIFMIFAVIGLIIAVMNGVPMKLGTVNNDGANAVSVKKNSESMQSFWIQMKINERISSGVRLRDMPEDWFYVPSDEGMKNSMTAALGVFACNRLIDEHRFEEAENLMERLLEMDSAIAGMHRSLLICDIIYCELIGENRRDKINAMLDAQQKKFMKSMQKFPSIIRTEYAYAAIAENNPKKARAIQADFEKFSSKYPYPSEIEAEAELMRIADKTAKHA